jgi:hypothetical protein
MTRLHMLTDQVACFFVQCYTVCYCQHDNLLYHRIGMTICKMIDRKIMEVLATFRTYTSPSRACSRKSTGLSCPLKGSGSSAEPVRQPHVLAQAGAHGRVQLRITSMPVTTSGMRHTVRPLIKKLESLGYLR